MSAPDYITLLLYLVGIFVISTLASRRTSNQSEMFSAGRRSPWWASGLSGFMTMFSAGTFVVWGGVAYQHGLVAVMINTCYGVAALLVGYFVAGRWNQLGVATPAEYVNLRFGKTGLHFFTWTMLMKRILGVSVSLYSLAILLVALIPLDLNIAIVLFGAIVVIYTMQGGLWAVLMTDVLQFIVLTVVVFMVAVLMIADMGSPTQFASSVPPDFFLPVAGKYGWFFLFGWVTIHFFMIGAEWAFVQRFIAVRTPTEAKKSAYLFGIMYLVTPIFWLLPPLLFRGQVEGVDKEQAYILAAQSVLPPGILGLMFAAMFSATASMVSSQLNVFAGVLTHDFYHSFFNPTADEKTLVRVGRVFTAVLGALLVLTAILVPSLGGAEKLIITINSLLVVPLFAPTLWGLFSRTIGIREMIVVALTSFIVGLTLRFGIATNPWIDPSSNLHGIKNYLAENSKNVELMVGVILPVVMLAIFQLTKRGTDAGAATLESHCHDVHENTTEENQSVSFDPVPAKMVMYSLLGLGIWMMLLSLYQTDKRVVVLTIGSSLLLVALVIQRTVKRYQSR